MLSLNFAVEILITEIREETSEKGDTGGHRFETRFWNKISPVKCLTLRIEIVLLNQIKERSQVKCLIIV